MIVQIVPDDDGKSHFEHLGPKDWHVDWQVDPVNGPVSYGNRPQPVSTICTPNHVGNTRL